MLKLISGREFKKLLKTAFSAVLKNRLRSLLTAIGIILGVSAVIIISAIGKGSQTLIEKEINDLGTNVLIIVPGGSNAGGVYRGAGSYNRFTITDVQNIREQSGLSRFVSPIVQSGGQIIAGNKNWNSEITGASTEFFLIKNWQVRYGNYFSVNDIRQNRKVLLLGSTVADALFGNNDPTGKTVRIRNIPFKVVGVLEEKGQSSTGKDQDDIIIAPWSTVLYRLKGGRYIDMIYAGSVSRQDLTGTENEIREILRSSHHIGQTEDDDFEIHSQTEITQTITRTTRILTLLMTAIASISLLVGGIGIMNIMLVSVIERTSEIGIRLSVGARASDIMVQFLIESIVLSLLGGIFGVIFALAVIWIGNTATNILMVLRYDIILLSFIFSAGVGIFFGFYPALKASRLNPIDSLRYE
ncbi:MAG TPA: ABC transporter permease [Bacteroidales bacterium]|jgi:putative ABC transport system permease protein|nr:ABC transporter permease [Bacteroidales bacterium]